MAQGPVATAISMGDVLALGIYALTQLFFLGYLLDRITCFVFCSTFFLFHQTTIFLTNQQCI